jgi:REP-associated tyrosine transposase
MQPLHRNSNAVFRLIYHLVLVTKYRRRVFTGPMVDRARTILETLATAWDGALLECSGEADHLHALLDLPPKARPSDVVNNLKTVTSRRLRAEFPALRAAYRGTAVLWSPSYGLVSAGGAPIEVLKRYVEAQDRPR